MDIRRALVVVFACMMLASLVLSAAPTVGAARSVSRLSAEERDLVDHLDSDYAMDLASRLSSFPYKYGGEVVPGSPEDLKTAQYVANEMKAVGLDQVTYEPFKLVNWNYMSASLDVLSPSVSQPSITTRSMANSPSTPPGGLKGELIYVGLGRNVDYDMISGGVAGKIVLIERSVVMYYTTPAVGEAAFRGAVGALIQNPWRDPAAINVDTAHNSIPTLSISGNDAEYLKGLLQQGEVVVNMVVKNEITVDANAYAVYGFIWGSKYPDEYIVLEGHHDHWWNGANDDNGGVASTLAVAKAIKEAGIVPKRTMVFMTFSGHESGAGGSKESHWDWGLGSYYFMNVVHTEWSKKVVWSSTSDGGGVKADYMFVETTPELKGFLKKVAFDVGVPKLMTPYIFTPVSSFDGWGFYMAGVPTSNVYYGALSALVEEAYYHTDLASMALLGPEHIKMDAAFRGVAGLRISQSVVLPYKFVDTAVEIEKTIGKLMSAVPDADEAALAKALKVFKSQADRVSVYIQGLKNPSTAIVKVLDSKLLEVVNTVNPWLWDQDIGLWNPYPGWASVTKFETFTNDMASLKKAITALQSGSPATALRNLEQVVTMSWGQYVSYPVYQECVWLFNGTPYLNWATGHLPWLTNVHQNYNAIKSGTFDSDEQTTALGAKLALLYEKLGIVSADVTSAFDGGVAILATVG